MTPATIVLLLNAALGALPELMQQFNSLKASGAITPEDQAKVQTALDALRAKDFTSPEWKIDQS